MLTSEELIALYEAMDDMAKRYVSQVARMASQNSANRAKES